MPLKDNIIRTADLFDAPLQVLAVPEVSIERVASQGADGGIGLDPFPATVVGVYLPATGASRFVTVTYHFGFRSWCCHVEHQAQKAPEFDRAPSLEAAIARFTALTGISVPEIKVTEYGVGIYDARTGPGSAENPWRLEDGEQIEVFHKTYGWRRFIVIDSPGGQLIDQIVDGAPQHFASRAAYLTCSEWKSLRRVTPEESSEKHLAQEDATSPSL